MDIKLEDVKKYLTDNAEAEDVKGFMTEFKKPTEDSVAAFLQNEDSGKVLFQKLADKRVTEALNTYKTGHFKSAVEAAVEEEIRNRYPAETEEQKRIRDLEKKFETAEKEANMQKLVNYALKVAGEKNLGSMSSVMNLIHESDSEKDVLNKIVAFEEDMKLASQQAVNKIIGTNKSGSEISGDDKRIFTMEELKHMSPEQYAKNRKAVMETLRKGV